MQLPSPCRMSEFHCTPDLEQTPGWSLHALQTSEGTVGGWVREWSSDGVVLLEESLTNVSYNFFGTAPTGFLVFSLIVDDCCDVRLNGLAWKPREIVIGHGGQHIDLHAPPTRLVTVMVKLEVLTEYLVRQYGIRYDSSQLQRPKFVRDGALVNATQACLAALSSTHSEPGSPSNAQARSEILQASSRVILQGMHEHCTLLKRSVHVEMVYQARRRIFRQAGRTLRVAELCEALGVSRRALQMAFQEVVGVPPVAYLRLMRLDAARRLLLGSSNCEQVQDVLEVLGIAHASHFSTEYSALFGERPSETLRRRGARQIGLQ